MESVRVARDGPLTWVEIYRPDRLNALDRETLLGLREVLLAAREPGETRVLLLTGAGERAFAAGADIAQMAAGGTEGIREFILLGKEVTGLLEEAPLPVLAVVNGYALGGGCELALACDLILAAKTSQLGLPEVDLALLPGWGGTARLERRVGFGRAREMVLTGRRVSAAEGAAWGLCDRVYPRDRLREEAGALARLLAGKDPGALSAARRALRLGAGLPASDALALETDLFLELFARPEREAAMASFLKK